jgi:tetratricopeptide (TPR) repeat protein
MPFALALFFLTSCNRIATPPAKQLLKDADTRATNGDFLQAINLYEEALDGSEHSAEIHYRIALLYDDKMGDPLNALHHFKRYLTLTPTGSHAEEVKGFMKRDELALLTTLSGDSVVSRAEAARLKNENLELRKQLDEQRNAARNAPANEKGAPRPAHSKSGTHSKKRTTKQGTQ